MLKSGFDNGQCSYSGTGRMHEKLVTDAGLGSSFANMFVVQNLSVWCNNHFLPRLKGEYGGAMASWLVHLPLDQVVQV